MDRIFLGDAAYSRVSVGEGRALSLPGKKKPRAKSAKVAKILTLKAIENPLQGH